MRSAATWCKRPRRRSATRSALTGELAAFLGVAARGDLHTRPGHCADDPEHACWRTPGRDRHRRWCGAGSGRLDGGDSCGDRVADRGLAPGVPPSSWPQTSRVGVQARPVTRARLGRGDIAALSARSADLDGNPKMASSSPACCRNSPRGRLAFPTLLAGAGVQRAHLRWLASTGCSWPGASRPAARSRATAPRRGDGHGARSPSVPVSALAARARVPAPRLRARVSSS